MDIYYRLSNVENDELHTVIGSRFSVHKLTVIFKPELPRVARDVFQYNFYISVRRDGDVKRIAVILTDLFEDVEYSQPVKAFKQAGYRPVTIGSEANRVVRGRHFGALVKIERPVREANVADFAALLIPGGISPHRFRTDADAVRFVRQFVKSGKPVFTGCRGPQLLISADILRGRKLTGRRSIVTDIRNAGGLFVDQPVVEDANLVSSRDPGNLPAFIEASLKKLGQSHSALDGK